MIRSFVLLCSAAGLSACSAGAQDDPGESAADVPAVSQEGLARATFAGGCFWCMEPPFDKVEGVVSTTSGYMGGTVDNPSYKQVTTGRTGHAEVVQVLYDPSRINYAQLLTVFWRNVDPVTRDQQFCDRGNQYRSAIFYHDEQQKRLAEASLPVVKERLKVPGQIVTQIVPATEFWPAEEYHQDYYKKNPVRYKFYSTACGRDARLKEVWGR